MRRALSRCEPQLHHAAHKLHSAFSSKSFATLLVEQAADRMPGPTLLLAVRSGICRTHTCTRRDRVPAGMWYHLSTFLDDAEWGVAYATVTTASALSAFVGGPAAALLLSMNGFAGLTGWQWYVLRPGAMHVGLTWAQTQSTQISPPSVACGPISLATGR